MTPQEQVEEFHRTFRMPIADMPIVLGDHRLAKERRLRLIQEEVEELKVALDANDMIEVADALGDLLYVVYGSAIEFGFDLDAVVTEIHESNMSKAWDSFAKAAYAIENPEHDADSLVSLGRGRWVVYGKKIGKVMKPDTWIAPDLEPILEEGRQ